MFQVMEGVKEITRNGAKFMDGQEKEFSAIILATGYKSNVPTWLKVRRNFKVELTFSIFTSFLLNHILVLFFFNLIFIVLLFYFLIM